MPPNQSLRKAALERALDIRKFEIDLYWRRATYFWTFIAASLAAYGVVQGLSDEQDKTYLSVVVGSLGLVFSLAWYCANRGSKQWQENWEAHVDLLEDEIVGPLYKTVICQPRATGVASFLYRFIVGPGNFSVSKINQLTSLFVTALWVPLLWHALPPFSRDASIDWTITSILLLAAVTCLLIACLARTNNPEKPSERIATRRTTTLIED